MKSQISLICISILSLISVNFASPELEATLENIDLEKAPALQNQLLRSYFLKYRCAPQPDHVNLHTSRLGSNQTFRRLVQNRCVDIQIKNLLQETREDLMALDEAWDRTQIIWLEMTSKLSVHPSSDKNLRKEIRQLGKRAVDLKNDLRFLGGVIEDKEERQLAPDPSVQREMAYIDRQITAVGQTIRNYLFEMNCTVKVDDLSEGNMLVRLSRIEKIARQLAEK